MKPAHIPVVVLTACALVAPFVHAQESAQVFTAPVFIGTGLDSFRLAFDMNGDGDQDALSVWFQGFGGMTVSGWRNDGAGKLVPGWTTNSLPLVFNPPPNLGTIIPAHFAKGDFNADGSDDFVFALEKQVGWWISNGDSVAPAVPWAVQLPAEPTDLDVADFTGDGVPDVAILLQGEVRIYATQPAAAPSLLASFPFTPADATRVVALELSGAGGPDLAILRPQSGSVQIHPVVGGVIQPGTGYAFAPVFTATLADGDIDADGDADLVVRANVSSAQIAIYVLRRTGPGAFNLEAAQVAPQVSPNPPQKDGLFDLDADGDLDLVSVSGTAGIFGIAAPTVNLLEGFAYLRRNGGAGAFGPLESWPLSGATGDFGVADLDGDGDQDMVAGSCVSYGVPGAFPPGPQLPVEPIGIGSTVDVDRDGDPDLGPGVPGVDLNGASVPGTAVNDGNGGFATGAIAAPPAPAGTSWCGPGFAGDFDGDGAVDLLVEHLSGTTPSSAFEMRFLRNVGGGSLVDGGPATAIGQTMRSVPIQGGSFPTIQMGILDWHSVIVADLDGDSDLDAVTLYPRIGSPYSVTQGSKVWLNGGSGFFTPGQDMPAIYPSACAELTGDSIADLVGMRQLPSTLSELVVVPGLGGGAFGAPIPLYSSMPNVTSQNQVVAIDWDHDSDSDIVAVTPGLIVRFTNTGGFAPFQPWTTIAVLGGANTTTRLAVGDLDGDGLFDVVANPSESKTTRVWLGASSGPLASPVTYSAGMGSLADVDGDGDLDFLSGGIAVPASPPPVYSRGVLYRNRTVSPPQSGLRLQYGTGLAGSGGYVPVLGSAGVLRVGFSGEIRLSNALGGAQAYLGLGFAPASVPAVGGTLLIAIDSLFPFPVGGPAGIAGAGFGVIPWTLPPGLGGVQIFEQAATLDPAAPQGFALTQGVHAIIGF